MSDRETLVVYNPLPVAYAHREKQLVAVLGDDIDFVRTDNEGLSGLPRIRALVKHLRVVRRLRKSTTPVLVTWPLLGWLEVLLWSAPNSSVHLSVHDPRPLRRQIGLGTLGAWWANRVPIRRRPHIICHSSVAAETTQQILRGTQPILLPLPMLPPRTFPGESGPTVRPRRVLVLGQYKPARDLEMLAALGTRFPALSLEGVIAGRGWPDVAGWNVHDRFLSEDEFDQELLAAGCLLVPYLHYFQSGVALRAVELGTPVVGARHPFLIDSLGLDSSPGIVDNTDSIDAWLAAITGSLNTSESSVGPFDGVRAKWTSWLLGTRLP